MINWEHEESKLAIRKEVTEGIKEIITESLMIEIDPKILKNDQALFGNGLELDSIDALELSIGIAARFDVELDDDDMAILGSINKLTDFIMSRGYPGEAQAC